MTSKTQKYVLPDVREGRRTLFYVERSWLAEAGADVVELGEGAGGHFLHRMGAVHGDQDLPVVVVVQQRQGEVVEDPEAVVDHLERVVGAAGGVSAGRRPFDELLPRHVQVEGHLDPGA